METNQTNQGTGGMAAPQILDYGVKYKITPTFRNDLKMLIKELAYVDAKNLLNVLDDNQNVLSASILNQFIRRLSLLPYKVIHPIMDIIDSGDKEKISKYFQRIQEDPAGMSK